MSASTAARRLPETVGQPARFIQAEDYDAAVTIAREYRPGHALETRQLAGYA
jgi:hypothetical protein